MSEIHVSGLVDLEKMLRTLPDKMERNILRSALRAGAREIQKEAKERCPSGEPSREGRWLYGHYKGALRDSIRISFKKRSSWLNYRITAGGKTKRGVDVFYAHMIEFTGAAAHEITPKKFGSLFIGGLFRKAANHPGMRPRPFMRPALDSQSGAAIIAVGNYIRQRLTKAGLESAADVVVEGEE